MITPLQAKSLKAAKAFDMHHGSNLFVSTNGYDRIQAIYDNMNDQNLRQVVVEKYDTHFKIKSQKFLSLDYLTPARTNQDHIFWGGIYPGSQYYFIVTAVENTQEDDSFNVMRVALFNKNWHFVNALDLNEKNTHEKMFNVLTTASLAMYEYNGYLYLSTAYDGYAINKFNHTGKLNLIIDLHNLSIVSHDSDLYHSFDQYLAPCQGHMYQMEFSEGGRHVLVEKLYDPLEDKSALASTYTGASDGRSIFDFFSLEKRPLGMVSYDTGTKTGGFSTSDSSARLLSTGCSVNQEKLKSYIEKDDDSWESKLRKNVWLASTSSDFQSNTLTYLTHFSDHSPIDVCNGPYITKINDERFLIMWEIASFDRQKEDPDVETGQWDVHNAYRISGNNAIGEKVEKSRRVQYCYVNGQGQKLSKTYQMQGQLSTCQPILNKESGVAWYTCVGGRPVFYIIHNNATNTYHDLNPQYNLKNIVFKNKIITYDGNYHKYPMVKHLPHGVNVHYAIHKKEDDLEKQNELYTAIVQNDAGKYPLYASFRVKNIYARILYGERRKAYLIIKKRNINTLKYKKVHGSRVVLYLNKTKLKINKDYTQSQKGTILTLKGKGNFTGKIRIHLKTGKK